MFGKVDLEGDDESVGGELQYLFRSEYFNFVTGAGYFDIDSKDKITTEFFFVITDTETVDRDVHHTNAYLYTYINLLEDLTLTVGASGDSFDADDKLEKDQDQFNPKLGVTWNPLPGTTLRGAAFRVLKRTVITDQTVEPTQVAGFNQFFDELNATDYWVLGGAVDQKFTQSIYGGVEYTYRDLNVPWVDFTNNNLENANWDEKIFRAYLFWTPHEWLSLSAEYLWERLERDEDFGDGVETAETDYVPLGINFFHPSGLSASLTGTYVDQQGRFEHSGALENGDDDFFLVDAAIRYRFPKRYGFLTVGVSNLTDEDFEYFDSDPDNPRIQPDRVIFGKVTLALP